MNQKSAFQVQYPLSSKKFWKKIYSQAAAVIIFGAFVGCAIGGFIGILLNNGGTAGANISWLSIVPWMVIFTLGIIGLWFFLYGSYVSAYINRYYYDCGPDFITIKKGVFAPTEIHVQWQKIQDVYVDQDILDRIMGLYDVHIASATASSGIEAHIDGVDHQTAEALKQYLLDKVSGAGRGSFSNPISQPLDQTQSSQTAQSKPAGINLSEEISSNKYPLSDKWITVNVITRILNAIVVPFILIIIFIGKAKSFSLEDNFHNILLFWIGLALITFFIRVISLFLWKKNYAFNFTPEHIYYKEGVFSISEKHMPYSSIQDVSVSQSFVERIFGLSKVIIENAAQQQAQIGLNGQRGVGFSGVMLQGLNIEDANKITDLLKTNVLGKNSSHYGL